MAEKREDVAAPKSIPPSGALGIALGMVQNGYGRMTFGLGVLLVIWFIIVKPELNTNRIDVAAQREIANALQTTATTLDLVTQRLERVAERIDHN